MTTAEYMINSAKTFKDREVGIDPKTTDLLHCAIGIVTEVGELGDAIILNKSGDKINLLEEIGDVAWYLYNLRRMVDWKEPSSAPFAPAISDINRAVTMLVVEASELMDHFKRGVYYFKGLDYKYISEKTDYIEGLLIGICYTLNIEFSRCRQANIDKLAKRYPGNFFTPEAALNRDIEAERKELEKE